MRNRRLLCMSVVIAAIALATAPTTLADVIGRPSAVHFAPAGGPPGTSVVIDGLTCAPLDQDPARPLSALDGFHLTTASPDELLASIDSVEWAGFLDVLDPGATMGRARFVVPDLPDGSYQLWWTCRDEGAAVGIHRGDRERFTVGDDVLPELPTTDTTVANDGQPQPWLAAVLVLAAAAVGLLAADRRTRRVPD